ncbi:hypothetical protein BCF33_2050 [Hasllibacter halocynthiae]|uniref:Inner membrane protein n=1 Tax=Hasllibacter halocynthiae TaxID=595589 RepID=A0A2T0X2U8_9RHOB|nr:hypothetical protein [Hasllibacter halocynthiae]PRY93184.1 hypothetical protein BCF33_2050 [Hasllibacter halocynthiae]
MARKRSRSAKAGTPRIDPSAEEAEVVDAGAAGPDGPVEGASEVEATPDADPGEGRAPEEVGASEVEAVPDAATDEGDAPEGPPQGLPRGLAEEGDPASAGDLVPVGGDPRTEREPPHEGSGPVIGIAPDEAAALPPPETTPGAAGADASGDDPLDGPRVTQAGEDGRDPGPAAAPPAGPPPEPAGRSGGGGFGSAFLGGLIGAALALAGGWLLLEERGEGRTLALAEDRIETLEAALAAQEGEVEDLRADALVLSDAVEAAAAAPEPDPRIAVLLGRAAALEEGAAGAEGRIAALEDGAAGTEGRIVAMEEGAAGTDGRLAEVEAALAGRLDALEATIGELAAAPVARPGDAADASLADLEGDAALASAGAVAQLRGTVGDLRDELEGLRERAGGTDSRLEDLGGRVDRTAERLDGLGARVETAEGRLDDLGGRTDEAEGRLDRLDGRLGGLGERLEGASGRLDRVAGTADEALSGVEAIRADIAGREAAITAEADRQRRQAEAAARAAEARAALGRVEAELVAGRPYREALADLRALAAVPVPEPLERNASTGVATLTTLRQGFAPAARRALAAAPTPEGTSPALGFLSRQIGLRSVEPRPGTDPDAVLSRAQAAVDDGDIARALREIGALDGGVRAPLAAWVGLAEDRVATLAAAEEMSSAIGIQ